MMNRIALLILSRSIRPSYLAIIFILTTIATPALSTSRINETNNSSHARYQKAIQFGQHAVQTMMALAGIPGLAVAMAIDGDMVWSEGFGYADLEHQVAVTTHTRFRIGSVSKILTAAAIAKLYEQGRLDLNAPIRRYLPDFPDKGHPITARQLAGHLAGIRGYQDKDFAEGRPIDLHQYHNMKEALSIFQDDPLIAEPGTRCQYSVFGYTLLSAIVEVVSGQDFLAHMDEDIFQPLQMHGTCADQRSEIRSRCQRPPNLSSCRKYCRRPDDTQALPRSPICHSAGSTKA